MTTLPPIITGSSRRPLNVMPVWVASTSIASVRRTRSAVPIGTVIDGGGAVAGSGGGGGGVFRAENSTRLTSSTENSATRPLSWRMRTTLTSALMNDPSTTLPERSFTRSADSVALVSATITNTLANPKMCLRIVPPRTAALLHDGQRCCDLQVDDQQDLVFHLEEFCCCLGREDRLEAIIVLHLERVSASLEIERPASESVGHLVGDVAIGRRVLLDEGESIVVQLRQRRLVLTVDRPELFILRFCELHHLGNDRNLFEADIGTKEFSVGAEISFAGIHGGRRLGCLSRRCR